MGWICRQARELGPPTGRGQSGLDCPLRRQRRIFSLFPVSDQIRKLQRNLWVAWRPFRVMIWLWLSTSVVLLSAELNAEIEHQTSRDSTVKKVVLGPAKSLPTWHSFHINEGARPLSG